jgi:Flp pilus assembly protein TadG
MPSNLWNALASFGRDRRANFAMTTAICALPLFGVTGLAIDYGILLSNKAKLDAAADAAAIAAVTKARSVIKSGGLLTDALTQGKQQGLSAFAANAGRVAYSAQGSITPSVNFDQPPTGQSLTSLTVRVAYSMKSQSQFGKIFNVNNYSISGSTSSNTVLLPYYQFIFVVDVSNSMAVGGTSNDIAGLIGDKKVTNASKGLTGDSTPCAFACHSSSANDPRTVAKNDGWKLKIDYVNSAVTTFVQQMDQNTTNNVALQGTKVLGNFAIGIDQFGTKFKQTQVPVAPPSMALSAAQNIDVEYEDPSNNHGYTYTTTSLNSALKLINNIGDGSSPQSQATYVIFVSDGVEDQASPGANWGRTTDLSYTSACNAIKQQGITLITIEAAYPAIPNDTQYAALVAPFQPPANNSMQSSMQSCASDPSWAYRADDGPGIVTAVNSILAKVTQGLTRLTY